MPYRAAVVSVEHAHDACAVVRLEGQLPVRHVIAALAQALVVHTQLGVEGTTSWVWREKYRTTYRVGMRNRPRRLWRRKRNTMCDTRWGQQANVKAAADLRHTSARRNGCVARVTAQR